MPNSETRICQNCHSSFVIDVQDFKFYEKVHVPAPSFCWLCRAQRRFAFRNERFLYKRKSDFSGKEIFSKFPPESSIKAYEKDIWQSDQWDPLKYGKEIDFSTPFLTQLFELFSEVPQRNLSTIGGINSEYSNNFTDYKNCYLVFNGSFAEDCMYGNGVSNSKNCVDISHIIKSESCYESFWLTSCYNVFFSAKCENSFNLFFCKKCIGCHDCFGCVNLRYKNYHIFNKSYSKEGYYKQIKKYDLGSFKIKEKLKKEVQDFWLRFPNKFMEGSKNINVSGDYIYNSKNVLNSYLVREGENLRYCQYLQDKPNKDCYDHTIWGDGNQLSYENAICGEGTYNIKFCIECFVNVKNLEYCLGCQLSSNLFGCSGLRHKQYCILNKQCSKEEYEKLVPKIIEHMNNMPYIDKKSRVYKYGEFFPIEFSPFAYNQTIAYEHFPLSKKETVAQGYYWKDSQERQYQVTISWKDLPDHIGDVSESIVNEIVLCKDWDENYSKAIEHNCTKAFHLTSKELNFYRQFNLPLPRMCFNSRHLRRIKQRNSLKSWRRFCQCAGQESEKGVYQNTVPHFHQDNSCPNEFQTTYAPERPEIIYCDTCYLGETV